VTPTGRGWSLALAATALVAAASPAHARDDAEAALKAGGCTDDIAASDLAPWAGGPPGLSVAASVSPQDDGDTIGELCVVVVSGQGTSFAPVARTADDAAIRPPADVQPMTASQVTVQKTPFRFSPTESAVAVSAGGYFSSSSTGAYWDELYLMRLRGGRLAPIFHAMIEQGDNDNTPGGVSHQRRWIVRFDTHVTRGAYDLILSRKGARGGVRYVWNGARYVAARGG
jgi:hypothetical protein